MVECLDGPTVQRLFVQRSTQYISFSTNSEYSKERAICKTQWVLRGKFEVLWGIVSVPGSNTFCHAKVCPTRMCALQTFVNAETAQYGRDGMKIRNAQQ